ncbi:hypothetical protein NC653_037410 [Populus alba x Populus x berolinensis]|uniref:Uncharacterized protein n=1 Tax=Populus alba x Populus x berolinensis TaxID=444605 RepID=A0AAD6LGX0_9ROSI|nr:hypothetical protein NC653_037410 [Populus alba x Populus x berolinensis]
MSKYLVAPFKVSKPTSQEDLKLIQFVFDSSLIGSKFEFFAVEIENLPVLILKQRRAFVDLEEFVMLPFIFIEARRAMNGRESFLSLYIKREEL